MKVRVLYVNTHVGQSIFQGGLGDAVSIHNPDVVVAVEVARLRAKLALRRLFPRKKWSIAGYKPVPVPGWVGSGTHIIAKRSVLKKKWEGNPLMTRQRWVAGKRDKWHPLRRLTRANYVFAGRQSLALHIGADHAWTHAGHPLHGDHEVPTKYRGQIHAYANAAGRSVRQDVATADFGDMNALPADGDFVKKVFRDQGMEVLYRQGLDFLLGNDRVDVVSVKRIPKEEIDSDHDAFVVELEVR